MSFELLKPLIVMGLIVFLGLWFGLRGLLNKNNAKASSQYYMSVNLLISGLLAAIMFVTYLFYVLFWQVSISKEDVGLLMTAAMIVFFLVSGLYGVLHKEKINNPLFHRFARQGVGFAIIGMVGLMVYWLMWRR